MKGIKWRAFAVAVLLWGMSCSSSNTDMSDTSTATTSENMATDTAAAAASDTTTGVTSTQPIDTTSFAVVAASSDMFEILSSTEARTRATHADVKKFAEQMITDHTKTSTELKGIADKKNILLPASPLPMHQRMISALSREEAKEFDETYMEQQVMAHRTTIALFETAANTESDPELKAFAQKHLPSLRMHLDMAKKTKDKVD